MGKMKEDLEALGFVYTTDRSRTYTTNSTTIRTEYFVKGDICITSRRIGNSAKKWHLYRDWDSGRKCGKLVKYEFQFHNAHIETYLKSEGVL
jgi:hypothetical protein